ncbi:MAG: prolipoprotein diacylglyceryl transferase [Brumimicrobium sp.]
MIAGIIWNFNPQIFENSPTPNWYGILFVTGLIIGYYVIKRMFKSENIPEAWLDKLLIYVVVATIVGARLGHVFFYDWGYYKDHLNEIIKIWEGGLASHGGAIAIWISLWLYSKYVTKKKMWWILDRIVAPIAIAGAFIRFGNLVNHEIVGDPTDMPWGFMFMRESISNMVEVNGELVHVFRHPTQLYEAFGYIMLFVLLLWMYWKTDAKKKSGLMFGVFLIILFGWRIFVEFFKVGQAARDDYLLFNTGQWLSVPFVIAGIAIVWLAMKGKLKEA